MHSPRLPTVLAVVIAGTVALAFLHGCQDTPQPTEPEFATVGTRRTLTVTGSGTGDGVVTSSPAGVNCTITAGVAGSTGCKVQFLKNTTVTLTAVAKSGHAFFAWFGYCKGSGTCQVPMTSDRSVTARFLKGPFVVKISSGTVGVGSGTVLSQAGLTPAINCVITNGTAAATGCSGKYPAYTPLTLTATPAPGFAFTGWGAPCSGSGTCTYSVIQAKTIPATFAPSTTTVGNPAVEGRWEQAFPTPVVAVHMSLLPSGRVIIWGDRGETEIWDPGSGNFTSVTKSFEFFCSGHTILPDGRLLVAGGRITGEFGEPRAALFDPVSNSWSTTGTMAHGRWYPSTLPLTDGQVLAMSGSDETGASVTIPEVWNGTDWRELTTAALDIPRPFYPALFVAPNGKVFLAGWTQTSQYLDPSGTGAWTPVADRNVPDRNYGSAVMYAPGKILYVGGGDPPTASAEVIDLNDASPAWRTVPGMAFARRHLQATMLPDGRVLVTHGTSGAGFNDVTSAVHEAELWDPVAETWTTMARESNLRVYHSTALLLPDGRVLSSGSGEGGGVDFPNSQLTGQIYTPPYLFQADGSLAPRPTIASAPSTISYGQTISVESPDAGSVTRGSLIRLSSVTHALNMSQHVYPLTFSATGPTTLQAAGPADGIAAPPGPYMLFLVDAAGVPSVAKMVTVGL